MKSYRRTPGSFVLFVLVGLAALLTAAVLVFLIAYILVKRRALSDTGTVFLGVYIR